METEVYIKDNKYESIIPGRGEMNDSTKRSIDNRFILG